MVEKLDEYQSCIRHGNKNTELFSHGEEKWVFFRFACISQAKKPTQ